MAFSDLLNISDKYDFQVGLIFFSIYVIEALNLMPDRIFQFSTRLVAFGMNILAVYIEIMTGGVGLKKRYHAFLLNIEARNVFSGNFCQFFAAL